MIKLTTPDAEQVAAVLEALAETIRESNEVPSTPFQVNTTDFRIELRLIQSASVVVVDKCGNCRGYRRGQGSVAYCNDPRSSRKDRIVKEDARPCQSYERVTNGK